MAIRISSLNHRLTAADPAVVDDMHLQERRWFAVRTSSRHEKKAGHELSKAGIECYVPLRERIYRYPSKEVRRELPLLTGYVFVRIRKEEELAVRRAYFVSSFVTLGKSRRQVTEQEMQLLRTLSTDRELSWDTVEDVFDFKAGTPVEIIKGPLVGVRGYYLSKKNKKTFLISLGSLGACLSTCEVDPTFLVALNGEPLANSVASGNEKSLW